jgi:hypothetical protein
LCVGALKPFSFFKSLLVQAIFAQGRFAQRLMLVADQYLVAEQWLEVRVPGGRRRGMTSSFLVSASGTSTTKG